MIFIQVNQVITQADKVSLTGDDDLLFRILFLKSEPPKTLLKNWSPLTEAIKQNSCL